MGDTVWAKETLIRGPHGTSRLKTWESKSRRHCISVVSGVKRTRAWHKFMQDANSYR